MEIANSRYRARKKADHMISADSASPSRTIVSSRTEALLGQDAEHSRDKGITLNSEA